MLSFTLLGRVALIKNEVLLDSFRSRKEAALLIYLAQSQQSHQRQAVAEMLWAERSQQQAQANLRTILTRLRKKVGTALVVTRHSVALNPQQLWVDSVALLAKLAAAPTIRSAAEATDLQEALALYQGDFLDDFKLTDSPDFDAWVLMTREHIRRQLLAASARLGHYLVATGEVQQATQLARRSLAVDPLDETANSLLLQTLIEQGKVAEAAHHYRLCMNLFRDELGLPPPAALTALLPSAQAAVALPQLPTRPRHNIPLAYNQFFGRAETQQDIHARLGQPWCRLVTLVGPGGIGKSRLAHTVAHDRVGRYAEGVWWVELAQLDPDDELPDAIATEILSTLNVHLNGANRPLAQLLNHLRHKRLLLILDNFEHVMAGVPSVLELLAHCPGVQLLVTSREPLRVQAEWAVPLEGLAYPADEMDDMPSEAVDLFAARCGQQQTAALQPEELRAARTICRMVEGLPLAIELAAALVASRSVSDIAATLSEGFGALVSPLRDIPARHRSLHTVFQMSWDLLDPALQERLAHLTLFQGSFDAAAAEQVAGADRAHLAALCDKSLLSRDAATGRYHLHPVILAYAAQKLSNPEAGRLAHAHHYLAWLAGQSEALQTAHPQTALLAIQPELENVRLAWQSGLAHRLADPLMAALPTLSLYHQLSGLNRQAEALMATTVGTVGAWGEAGLPLATRAGLELARFQNRLARYPQAIQNVQRALRLAQKRADHWAEGMAHVWWGEALWRQAEYKSAEKQLQQALAIGRSLRSTFLSGWAHHQLGIVEEVQGRYKSALAHLHLACDAWRELDNAHLLAVSLNSVGVTHINVGDLPTAQQVLDEALRLCRQVGNDFLAALLLNNLSGIAIQLERYAQAEAYLWEALALAVQNGDLAAQADIHINLGIMAQGNGDLDRASDYTERGKALAQLIGHQPARVLALRNLGDLARQQGETMEAEVLYRQAATAARRAKLTEGECRTLLALADMLAQRKPQVARQISAQALGLATGVQDAALLDRATTLYEALHTR